MNNAWAIPTLLTHTLATIFMAGLIWTIQIVHYPLMSRVGDNSFIDYETRHMQRITWVVAPAMLVELAAALALLVVAPPAIPRWMLWLGLALLALIWLSTAVLQGPAHVALARGFDHARHRWLVDSNWIRTILWSARALLTLAMIRSHFKP